MREEGQDRKVLVHQERELRVSSLRGQGRAAEAGTELVHQKRELGVNSPGRSLQAATASSSLVPDPSGPTGDEITKKNVNGSRFWCQCELDLPGPAC